MAIQTTTITTTTTSYTSTTGLPKDFTPKNLLPSYDDTDIGGNQHHNHTGGNGGRAIDNLPLPAWAKALLKSVLGDSGSAGSNLPSSADAAKSIRDFQKENKIGLLSSDQVKQMADTGYCTLPNGERVQVPPDIQAAAQKMMENNGDLFKKLESAIRGSHDGLLSAADYDAALKDGSIGKPGTNDLQTVQGLDRDAFLKQVMSGTISSNRPVEYNAAKTIHDFQKQHNIGLLNSDQLQQMAETGYCKLPNGERIQVPPDIQAAAQKMMENNGELFKKLESAVTGKFDGLLSTADFDKAAREGTINHLGGANGPSATYDPSGLPSSSDAAKTIHDFQQQHKIDLLSSDQAQQMAETGYCTLPNGDRIQVPPDVQAAAQKMMENNGELYKKLEAAIRGSHDGLLSAADYDAALKDGSIGKPGTADLSTDDADMIQEFQQQFINDLMNRDDLTNDAANGLPSSSDAAKTIHDFQQQHKIDLLSSDQAQQMAETGYCTLPNGDRIQVPPDVQAAAQKMMENNGELYKKLEAAIRGSHDGLLSAADYDAALKDGSIGKPGTADLSTDDADMIQEFQQQFINDLMNRVDLTNDAANGLPSSSDAAKSIHDFQQQHKIGLLSIDQVKQMADTGYCTLPGGERIQVPPDIQAAAQKMVENNGDLYKKLEAAIRGSHDGLLSAADYDAALKDGSIGKPGTKDL